MNKPDFLSDADWAHVRDQTSSLDRIRSDGKADVADYLANPDGRTAGKGPSGLPTLLLTTVGRKSGEKRTVALVFLQHGDDMVIVASLAGYDQHPAWYLNLGANPRCWVQRDRHRTAAVAREASEAERRDLWPRLNAVLPLWGHFQSGTDRSFPIVILSPTGDA
ncbi:MAG: nitroreductase family deazaflavin-dependent oxidoreductase [Deltaproteobacteria bacterium]|nr:nitroreductase family deazaflavin-dependent oxidoreductase [Deltaproteobacteria bacterium]